MKYFLGIILLQFIAINVFAQNLKTLRTTLKSGNQVSYELLDYSSNNTPKAIVIFSKDITESEHLTNLLRDCYETNTTNSQFFIIDVSQFSIEKEQKLEEITETIRQITPSKEINGSFLFLLTAYDLDGFFGYYKKKSESIEDISTENMPVLRKIDSYNKLKNYDNLCNNLKFMIF